MDGVAVGADDVVERMLGSAYVGARQGLGVATQAIVEDFTRLQLRESDDRGFAAVRVDVRLAGTMATLTSGALRWFLPGSDAFEVRVFVEAGPHIGVTRPAYVAADESGASS